MRTWISMLVIVLAGCAALHKTQIAEIDNRAAYTSTPFEIKVSETGVDLQQIAAAGHLFKRNTAASGIGKLAAIVSLFQMGPRTGAPVYVEHYADDILLAIRTQCPNGAVTGVTSIRETRKYPVVSGEIVKIRGYCLHNKQAAKPVEQDLYAELKP